MWNVCHLRHLPDITNKLIYDFSRVLRCAWDIVGDESVGFSTGFGKEWRQVWKETCHNCRDTSPKKNPERKQKRTITVQYLLKLYQQKASASQWLEDEISFWGSAYFQVPCQFSGGKWQIWGELHQRKAILRCFNTKPVGVKQVQEEKLQQMITFVTSLLEGVKSRLT